MTAYWLAQCNIARLVAPLDSPALADFVAALAPINELADRAPGFVWRLQTEDGDATAIRAFDDDMLIVNMSVWESIEALAEFVYRSAHRDVMRRRRQWFEQPADAHMVLWWIPAETVPALSDAQCRFETLRRDGPSPDAFTFRSPYAPPDSSTRIAPVADDWFCSSR
jgi:heme-degrading monooxygenase HmoA